MAVLFLLAAGLISWQAPHIRPILDPWYASVMEPGEQVFPIAVPNWEAPGIPAAPQARFAFLEERSVLWPASLPEARCDLFVRVSLHHWARRPVSAEHLPEPGVFRWTGPDFLDDDDSDGDPLDVGELRSAGPGAEAEIFCRP